ncbi:TAXI family TRAP transporter solute-binding subunit [Pseudomonas saliphila]|uniref:TAXI family TRAP transporter solute-binding subunit n=1 Tax=Pseudomonas saliphila TaxID=2586906 RepID=UPI001238F9B7|nr:TAXI family TRAP transporter solute-binding subunit [Pseudomonas saliphila]
MIFGKTTALAFGYDWVLVNGRCHSATVLEMQKRAKSDFRSLREDNTGLLNTRLHKKKILESRMTITKLRALAFVGISSALSATGVTSAYAEQSQLSVATAGTTGVFYAYGGAMANVVSKYVPTISMVAESTGGTVENLKMLGKGQADLATASADVVHEAYIDYEKSKHFRGKKVEMYGLFNMYQQPHHIVTLKNNDISDIEDIRGERVVVGAPGSGTEVKTRMMLESLGITYRDFRPEFLTFTEGVEALQDGTVEAVFLGVNYPAPAIMSLAMTNPVRLLSLSDTQASTIQKTYPFLNTAVIPGDTYKGVPEDTQTVSVQTLVVSGEHLSEENAYQIVKTVFEHKEELENINHAFKQTTLEAAAETMLPLHPGAARYYREVGLLN